MTEKSSLEISVITPKKNLFDLKLKEVWHYRDLLFLFTKRDITVTYKQTILGPLWFFIQPIFTSIMYLVVFGGIAKIPTDGIPPVVFYLAGITVWNFFSESLKLTSGTFLNNANIFGKVYFPRIIKPLSVVLSNLVRFGIQFSLFLIVYFYYYFAKGGFQPNITLLLLPYYIFVLALLALAFGLSISAVTTKYRDVTFLIQFGIHLWMYVTPVIYPLSKIPLKYKKYIMLNPVTSVIEGFKYSFTGSGSLIIEGLVYTTLFAVIFFLFSLAIFNRTEKTFMDTV